MTDFALPAGRLVRRPAFWVAYAVLAMFALALAWKLFPTAIPIVNVDISMSRDQAITQARVVAGRLELAPPDARAAVQFASDGAAQNYVELEGGGKPAFAALVRGELYSPYWWDVRLFTIGAIPEVKILFTPQGVPYGFGRVVAEKYVRDDATKAIGADAARALAETRAHDDWHVDFGAWKFLEQSEFTQTTGRVDHVFTYQRDERLGDARVRMRLGTAGDELVAVRRYVFIPDAFSRRFAEMRSANETIANVASLVAGLVYGIGGLIVAAMWLARKRMLLPKPAFIAGGIVGGLMGLMLLAATTGAWFTFDTAKSQSTFWAGQVGGAIAVMLGGALGYGLVFMTAEGLSRAAFGWQPQLWKLWSREGGASLQTAGRTAGGYLFIPIELALVAVFYYVTNKYFNWWQPSSEMTDPNVLSSAIPALAPIALSLQAGFMEECLFRAVPLSLGALIGAHFGRKRAGIAIAFVLQALVFGAAHANYPGFPSYSRLVELIVPSMIWAAIFLRFGLLPTILLHACFDLSLFAIPIFLVDAPGAWLQRALIVAAGLVPLAVVLARRAQARAFSELPRTLRNDAWRLGDIAVEERAPAATADDPSARARAFVRALPWLGIVGLIVWLVTAPFRGDVGGLALSRAAASAAADAALQARGVALPGDWTRSSAIRLASEDGSWTAHRFVWQEGGPDVYRAVVGHTLPGPLWAVRYARFTGDVVDRAEEWQVTVNGDGSIRQVTHVLPEGRAGATLSRAGAQARADAELRARFGVEPATLKPIAASDRARPARTDWSFLWTDPRISVGKDGEARLQVSVDGDEVTSSGRAIFIPEAWLRAESARDGDWATAKMAMGILVACAGIAALFLGVRNFARSRTDMHAARVVGVVVFATMLVGFANSWPTLASRLSTTDPVATQIALRIGGIAVAAVLLALFVGMIAGVASFAIRSTKPQPVTRGLAPWQAGMAAAFAVAGFASLLTALAPQLAPRWPSLGFENSAVPALAALLAGFGYLREVVLALFVLFVLQRITADWTRRVWVIALLLILLYAIPALGARDISAALASGLAAGLIATAVVLWLFRFDARALPAYVATMMTLGTALGTAQKGELVAWAWFALTLAVYVALAVAVTRWISRPIPDTAVTSPTPTSG
ncbi:MAG: CPBP family intramembrane glutamic endopeptidase [Betaproteobacteria bacterium]